MHDKKDDWSVGFTKNPHSKSVYETIPESTRKEYQFSRLTSDKFSYLPQNHPHEIIEERKNVYNGNTNSYGWECNRSKLDKK